jgi:hypothetical protein
MGTGRPWPDDWDSRRRWLFWAGLLVLLPFSFGWVWMVGHRGLFVLDQSIVFDGAWRLVQGQVPYRDFFMPFGPITFMLPALVFELCGVDFSSLVLTAAILSVAATAAAVRLLWLLSRSAALSLLGGLLTATWYQAPFGIPWMEQTAFFFDLIALLLIVEGKFRERLGWLWFVAAGIASVAAVLSKQNAGGLFVLVCLGSVWLPGLARRDGLREGFRDALFYSSGAVLAACAFVTWLRAVSEPTTFVHYWFEVSADVGLARFAYWKVLGTVFLQPLLGSSIPLFMIGSLIGGLTLVAAVIGRPEHRVSAPALHSAWLALALPQFQSAFQLTTNNEPSNNNAFVGICVSSAIALLVRAFRGRVGFHWQDGARRIELDLARRLGFVLVALLSGLAFYSVGEGLIVAHDRFVQEFPSGVRFDERLEVRGAARVLWGEPTHITQQDCAIMSEQCALSDADATAAPVSDVLDRRDLERLASYLDQRAQNFFVFPDTTLLYGLTGRPSPQPLLYFHPGQSFAPSDQPLLDRQIVASLQRNDVTIVVLERASYMGTHRLLSTLPSLRTWIESNFEPAESFGNYRVFEARSGAPRSLGARAAIETTD